MTNLHIQSHSKALKAAITSYLLSHKEALSIDDQKPADILFFVCAPSEKDLITSHKQHSAAAILVAVKPGGKPPSVSFPLHTIQKPFRMEHLIQLLDTITTLPTINLAHLRLYPQQRKIVSHDGSTLPLTEKEVALLLCLHSHKGTPVTKEHLLETVWGYQSDTLTHTVETHVYKLKQKLKDMQADHLIQLMDTGYKLDI